MRFQPIFFVIGILLLALGGAMVVPGVLDWLLDDPSWQGFMEAAAITLLAGGLFVLANQPRGPVELSLRETFMMTTGSWLVLAGFAALPFMFTKFTPSTTDSFFEAVSALTTTGASVIIGLDYVSSGTLLWRALLQWLGGIGIIVMALTVLPILHIGGMQLFHSEFSDRMEKILPRVSQITKAIFYTYVGLTIVCTLSLWWVGMNFFDAVCHGLTTVSTGGMSTSDDSIGHFNSVGVEIVMIIFMITGASTMLLFVQLFRGNVRAILRDGQIRTLISFVALLPLIIGFWRWYNYDVTLAKALRESFFNTISMITTSGFNTTNYGAWGTFPLIAFFIVIFIGGCTGSTASGIKIFRFKIMYALTKTQLSKLYRPHAVLIPTYNKQQISEGVFDSVFTFLALFVFSFAGLTLALAFLDLDFVTAVSGATAAITNLGPGFGPTIGPTGSYSLIPDNAKWLLMFGMILGRLELISVLVLFTPAFWRD